MEYRLSFFKEATLASIRAQSVLPTAWLVFLDDQAPDWLRDEMSALSEENRFLKSAPTRRVGALLLLRRTPQDRLL
ncbi:glycosyltransferase [Microbacterium sp. S308A+]|uniref:glycosyltransferase n=1 Tax=Microbacterium sp. S308A+ TaxID=3415135 RepID=UPI003C79B374